MNENEFSETVRAKVLGVTLEAQVVATPLSRDEIRIAGEAAFGGSYSSILSRNDVNRLIGLLTRAVGAAGRL